MGRVLTGLLLVVAGAFSYLLLFSRWPVTRDVPWTAYVLFAVALALMISGFRRTPRKVWSSIVMVAGIGLMAFFTYGVTIGTKELPASHGAPAVGQKAPDFTLPDANRRNITLSQLTGQNGVLLIFYRGYW